VSGRVIAIDYGLKRVGIAVTDPLRIIAKPLTTVENSEIERFLKEYIAKENVSVIVLGEPYSESGELQQMQIEVHKFAKKLQALFPQLSIVFEDERYTSRIAQRSLVEMGMKKSKRKDKKLLDTVSAALILQTYLEKHP